MTSERDAALLVLSGPPGAGKSTVARLVADQLPRSVHLVADTFWHHVRRGRVDPWLPEARPQNEVVMEALAASAREFARGGYDVVIDGVVGPWLLAPFLRPLEGVRVHYIVLRPDELTVVKRATARESPALVELAPLRHMFAEFAALGKYERHVLDTGALSAEATAERVLDLMDAESHVLEPR